MKIKYLSLTALVLFLSALGYYYFFVDTLSVAQIAKAKDNPKATIFFNMFDFDTDLTRYDVYRLSKKSAHWNERIARINSIQDPNMRNRENEKLLAEMMEDPAMKKILKKFINFGGKATLAIIKTIFGMAPF